MQLVPRVDAAARGAEAGEAQLGAVLVGQGLVGVDLVDVLAGHDHRELELRVARRLQVVHGLAHAGVGALAADEVVGLLVDAVERDLDVDVVHRRQALGVLGGDATAVGRELHADALLDAVLDDLEEVGPQHGLAAADVHVEHLHLGSWSTMPFISSVRELAGVAAARAGEAVDALEVAGVGPLPGEADGGVEALGQLVGERGHEDSSGTMKSPAASEVRAFSNDGQRRSSMPAA